MAPASSSLTISPSTSAANYDPDPELAGFQAPVAQAAEGEEHDVLQALDRRELREGARGFLDELLDHLALAVLLPLVDARERVQHVPAAQERDGEQELPVLELDDGDVVRSARGGPVHEHVQLARREPAG